MKLTLTLTQKLTLCFLLFAVLVWITGFFAVIVGMKETRKTYLKNTGVFASGLLTSIERDIHGRIETFQEYSNDLVLQRIVSESNRENEGRRKNIISRENEGPVPASIFLSNELSEELREKTGFYEDKYGYKVFPEVFITNKYGEVIAMSESINELNHSGKEWWVAVKRDGLYTAFVQDNKDNNIDIGLSIKDENGDFAGVIKFKLNIEEARNVVANLESETGHSSLNVVLVTKKGHLISSNIKDRDMFKHVKLLVHKVCADHDGTERVYYQKEEAQAFFIHVHSKGYMDYKGLGWVLIIESDPAHVFSSIYEFRRHIVYFSIIVTLIAIILGVISFNVISRQLRKLINITDMIGKGDLDIDVDISTNDEVGQLAGSFRNMTANLKRVTVKRDELEREITERQRAEENIQQSRIEWESTFDTIPDMITIHDKNYNIVRANRSAREILNLPDLEAFKPLKCYEYYHGKGQRPDTCMSCNTSDTKQSCSFEMFEPHLNKHVEVRAMPKYDRSGEFSGVIHIVRDISNTKRAEDKVQYQMKRINALHSVEKAITSTFDLNVSLDILLDQIIVLLNIDAAAVLLLNQNTNRLEYAVSKGFRSSALKYTKLKLGESNAGRAAIERSIVTIPNLKENIDGFERSPVLAEEEFIVYFAVPLVAKGQIKGVLEIFHRSPVDADPEWMDFLETVANQAAIAIDNTTLFEGLQRSNVELTLAYDTTIEGWSKALDMRDKETEGHSQRVTEMTVQTALRLGVKEDDIVHIRRGALLHDIGKMGVPDSILLKPGKLTDEEWVIMKFHPVYAYEMLRPIKYLHPAVDIPYCHHERWDGTGYPRGLKGLDIPLSARIFAIVDVWDALSSDRPYRPAWAADKVNGHIRAQSGTHFDPEIIEVFLSMDWSKIINPDQQG